MDAHGNYLCGFIRHIKYFICVTICNYFDGNQCFTIYSSLILTHGDIQIHFFILKIKETQSKPLDSYVCMVLHSDMLHNRDFSCGTLI